ncbi:MAG TPA: PilZ domain-containing protein [Candidatus Acidoferrales bacterium]|nr:PilZ domain-containing protein [Candidatus Acidoferrales bacterium]
METEAPRRSDRVSIRLLLTVSGTDIEGKEFSEPASTMLINRHGAVILLTRDVAAEQRVLIQRRAPSETQRQAHARIVGQFGKQNDDFVYGIEIADEGVDLWGVEFPPIAESNEAVARMLLECSNCRRREVVYLNEMELRAFESNRGIARHCKTCGVPSIWVQAAHEDPKKIGRSKARRDDSQDAPADGHEKRLRQRVRLKTRLTACVRQSGADDELAVCEDISPVGVCFRSKRRYERNAEVEVAVPYSPDSGNIFLPARIVYSEEIAKAGLFRHGTEYRRK